MHLSKHFSCLVGSRPARIERFYVFHNLFCIACYLSFLEKLEHFFTSFVAWRTRTRLTLSVGVWRHWLPVLQKFLRATKAKWLWNGCCVFTKRTRFYGKKRLKPCDLTPEQLAVPVDWTLVHSFCRYESTLLVITSSMSFPCLCRWRTQSFLNDARRETHYEVGPFVEAFSH